MSINAGKKLTPAAWLQELTERGIHREARPIGVEITTRVVVRLNIDVSGNSDIDDILTTGQDYGEAKITRLVQLEEDD